MRKHILLIAAVFPPEPVTSANHNFDLAVELSKFYNVTVLRPFPSRPKGKKYSDLDLVHHGSFNTILIDSFSYPGSSILGRFKESVDFGLKCYKYIKENHPNLDFIYNGSWQIFGYYFVAKAAVHYRIPYIVPIQDVYPETLFTSRSYPQFVKEIITFFIGRIDRYYQSHAARIRTISDELVNYLSETRNIQQDHFLTINNWQNESDFNQNFLVKEPSDSFIVTYVGSINEHANVDIIIMGFIKANIPNSQLFIYGGGNKKEYCQKLVNDMNADNISFDYVIQSRIPEVQARADVLVLAQPSGNGEFCLPSKMTAYMLSGKPVLASVDLDSATGRYITEGNCGLVVEPDNVEALSSAFKIFAHMNRDELKILGNNSQMFAKRNLSKEVNLGKLINAIRLIVDKGL